MTGTPSEAPQRREQLRRMRDEGARRIAELGLPPKYDLATLCARLGEIRERPITLVPLPMPASHPCGMWVAARGEDLIFFDANTTGAHQEHIILHELGHIICCHRGSGLLDDESARSLFPNLDPDIVRDMLMRATYDDAQEQEAEIIAFLLSERMGTPAKPIEETPKPGEKPMDRIERSLL
ncbi:toxin [Amycolatopsis orientalis]|uniref:toxin n=1 Tax=Amycolatopsis orientalis TaxID=31958 RepID=UPI0003A112EE|nr:toxin [Amycolatopsis orientalis]